jgi:uncharacterized protein YciI
VPEYFFYCRDKPGTGELRMQLLEAHWSFMDDYADGMIARGPTLTEDGLAATGSLHVVELPDAAAARVFAFEEPNFMAGVYAEVLIRRWRNLLGRTMWEFPGSDDASRFLVITSETDTEAERRLLAEHEARLIVFGELSSDDGSQRVGSALALEAGSRGEVQALLPDSFGRVEIHLWSFGGRR